MKQGNFNAGFDVTAYVTLSLSGSRHTLPAVGECRGLFDGDKRFDSVTICHNSYNSIYLFDKI